MRLKISLFGLIVGLFCSYNSANATDFSGLYVFGDSLSDSGASASAVMSIYKLEGNTCDAGHPCPPYYQGRLSNGPVGVEYIANALFPSGVTAANFHDYAVGGATSGIGNIADGGTAANTGIFNAPGMAEELGLYLSSIQNTGADPSALYLVWGGANDLTIGSSPTAAADNIATYVKDLALAGAEYIVVPNLPDLGLTPDGIAAGPVADAALSLATQAFNQELASQLGALNVLFPKTDIVQFDTYSLFNLVLKDPAAFGFTNTTDACFISATQFCSNPANYVFWDGEHPTTQLDAFLATSIISTVPVPPAFWMFATGLGGWFFSRRR